MSRTPTRSKAAAKAQAEQRERKKKHLNDLLDEGLKETFPASDTPVVIRPGHGIPTRKPDDSEG